MVSKNSQEAYHSTGLTPAPVPTQEKRVIDEYDPMEAAIEARINAEIERKMAEAMARSEENFRRASVPQVDPDELKKAVYAASAAAAAAQEQDAPEQSSEAPASSKPASDIHKDLLQQGLSMYGPMAANGDSSSDETESANSSGGEDSN
jgi:hypothetical protein